jgi:hypothetical protein
MHIQESLSKAEQELDKEKARNVNITNYYEEKVSTMKKEHVQELCQAKHSLAFIAKEKDEADKNAHGIWVELCKVNENLGEIERQKDEAVTAANGAQTGGLAIGNECRKLREQLGGALEQIKELQSERDEAVHCERNQEAAVTEVQCKLGQATEKGKIMEQEIVQNREMMVDLLDKNDQLKYQLYLAQQLPPPSPQLAQHQAQMQVQQTQQDQVLVVLVQPVQVAPIQIVQEHHQNSVASAATSSTNLVSCASPPDVSMSDLESALVGLTVNHNISSFQEALARNDVCTSSLFFFSPLLSSPCSSQLLNKCLFVFVF